MCLPARERGGGRIQGVTDPTPTSSRKRRRQDLAGKRLRHWPPLRDSNARAARAPTAPLLQSDDCSIFRFAQSHGQSRRTEAGAAAFRCHFFLHYRSSRVFYFHTLFSHHNSRPRLLLLTSMSS